MNLMVSVFCGYISGGVVDELVLDLTKLRMFFPETSLIIVG